MSIFKAVAAASLAVALAVPASASAKPAVHRAGGLARMSLRYADRPVAGRGRHHGLVALVGDRESGLGFYDLPAQYRGRLHARDRRGDAIRYAVASETGGYYYGLYDSDVRARHSHTVFNPVDGYGTPFFAGYYGPAGDPDDDDRGPFGRPYD